jgi:hypothetical protein
MQAMRKRKGVGCTRGIPLHSQRMCPRGQQRRAAAAAGVSTMAICAAAMCSMHANEERTAELHGPAVAR